MGTKRVVVALSGGVDSSVAAVLLKNSGFEVVGLTMCFGMAESTGRKPSCCGLEGIEDARRVARKLGIRHYVLNMRKPLEEWVIRDFCQEYARGRTPNPCVRCNSFLKFGALLKKAKELGAEYLATGHYARITKSPSHQVTRPPSYSLRKAKDLTKDQSYFLYRLNQSQLKHALFPAGEFTKVDVRKIAAQHGLSVAEKKGSQEICFIPGDDYRSFLAQRLKGKVRPGNILDKEGNILGRHRGLMFYTVGQREGLGIAKGYPLYITAMDTKTNSIIVGGKEDAFSKKFLAKSIHFIAPLPKKRFACKVKIRYNHKEEDALVEVSGKVSEVFFRKPQFAVTPGQSAVFYSQDNCLGGGIIEKVLG